MKLKIIIIAILILTLIPITGCLSLNLSENKIESDNSSDEIHINYPVKETLQYTYSKPTVEFHTN
ncbi:hypothetical protein MsAc7_02630 [Methanolapillus millepedarum]|uniref:Uncharacterized protein n=1 Tax=Methanolapillus millepedarum TaxID=3028296 RepID=A0AA96ZTQ7_9EURY|nr:hypothetical protein MsAc7_02630 [Methanosarcinaceae archaeon Ac7]